MVTVVPEWSTSVWQPDLNCCVRVATRAESESESWTRKDSTGNLLCAGAPIQNKAEKEYAIVGSMDLHWWCKLLWNIR